MENIIANELARGLSRVENFISDLQDENAALVARIEEHQEHGEAQHGMIAALSARLGALEQELQDHELRLTHQAEDQIAYLKRLDALDTLVQKWAGDAIGFGQKLDALTDQVVTVMSLVVEGDLTLGERLGALEQAAKDQARNSNASAIALSDRLYKLEREVEILEGEEEVPF